MTLIEAIKSGRHFRRPCFAHNWMGYSLKDQVMKRADGQEYCPCKEDILADDWEIEEKKVEITLSALRETWDRCFRHAKSDETYEFQMLAKELGLE